MQQMLAKFLEKISGSKDYTKYVTVGMGKVIKMEVKKKRSCFFVNLADN
jgi:hypothetical protein